MRQPLRQPCLQFSVLGFAREICLLVRVVVVIIQLLATVVLAITLIAYRASNQPIDVRRLRVRVPSKAAAPVIQIIDGNEQNVWVPGTALR